MTSSRLREVLAASEVVSSEPLLINYPGEMTRSMGPLLVKEKCEPIMKTEELEKAVRDALASFGEAKKRSNELAAEAQAAHAKAMEARKAVVLAACALHEHIGLTENFVHLT